MRWLFFATDPGRTAKWTCPSSSTATTRTTAWAWRFPATTITPGRMRAGSLASLSVDQPSPSSSSSLRSAARSMRASIKVPPLTRLRVVVGVRHDPARAADKSLHTGLQVIKAHSEMTRVAAGRPEPHTHGKNIPDRQQAQAIEADQWRLLGEFIDGGVADGEHRNPVDAVDPVVTLRVLGQDVRVEVPPRAPARRRRPPGRRRLA